MREISECFSFDHPLHYVPRWIALKAAYRDSPFAPRSGSDWAGEGPAAGLPLSDARDQ
tara:strand:+ start:25486 stop:25659 length:174 start_codon:yes stop_codon:yes gene_type:complete